MKHAFKAKLEYFSVSKSGADFLKKLQYKLPFGDLKDLIYNLIISQNNNLPGMSQGGNKVLTRKRERFRFFVIFQQILKKPHNPTLKQKGDKGNNEVSAVIVETTLAKAFLRKGLQKHG